MQRMPYDYLFEIYDRIETKCENTKDKKINQKMINKLVREFNQIEAIETFKFNKKDVLIIAIAWHEYIDGHCHTVDPIDIFKTLKLDSSEQIKELDNIIKLLKKNVFYTSRKDIYIKKRGTKVDKSVVEFSKISLFENNIEFHHNFSNIILTGKREDVTAENNKPYKDNQEFLNDWFSYVHTVYEFSNNALSNRRINIKLDDYEASEFLEVIKWRDRIEERMKRTDKTFPLLDLKHQYNLDDNELTILVHLIKEEIENKNCDVEELVKLISSDFHEMYQNKEYVSENSKLVKKGLIELSEGVFFLSSSSNVRAAPDIVRRVIMKTPVDDNEKLKQILSNNDILTLVEPAQNFDDLILSEEMKGTINFSLNQYTSNVDQTLSEWGLYDKSINPVKQTYKKIEPGMLMLFYGAPGSGKTFAAGAIAQALGKKLLVTDISRIQSKWVGDSEKNVRRIFSIFERIVHRVENPPVLLLNEADQFLMKRSDNANSSVDKMMNSMQNLFLEAFENLRGVLIATTNLRSNLDEAFSRRFHLKLEFPVPEFQQRKKLWSLHIPKTVPGWQNIDLELLASDYTLTGGQIKIIVKNACIEAASRKGSFQKLLQKDLIKYCELEDTTSFNKRRKVIGFGG